MAGLDANGAAGDAVRINGLDVSAILIERRALALQGSRFGRELYACRTAIERSFGNAASYGGGMGPLPAWVRGLPRVRTWVWSKLLIDGIRIVRNHGLRLL